MTTTEWARQRRRLSPKASAKPGRYNPDITPWVRYIHEALDDPSISKIVCMKSAQVAWTDGVLLNYIGKRIDTDPCPMILMFAKEQAAKEFNSEKFEPMVEATEVLGAKLPIHTKRDKDNRWAFKSFAGGFIKLVGSNSPSSVKSTPAPVVAVEEPDDCNENVAEQGDTITLLEERTKTYARRKVIFGGTPTVKGISRIEAAYLASDQRRFPVACPHCGEEQVLEFENLVFQNNAEVEHEVFGRAQPETARYQCPHCGALWTDAEKNRAVRLMGPPRAEAPFTGVAGFYINELYSPFPGSAMPILVQKLLRAQHKLAHGDDTLMRAFRNSSEGLPYETISDIPDGDDLKLRAETYAEMHAPPGALIVTAGVDVQHDRLAVIIRGWGRGEESWLLYWGEIYGSTLVPGQGAWADLDLLLSREIPHASGGSLKVSAYSVDGSDGNRTEIVNAYARAHRHLRCMAIKGASEQGNDKREIYSAPRKVDPGRHGKVSRKGLDIYIVGTHRAKDLILENRLKLGGSGPGRMHWYADVRADYWGQLTSEIKAPSKTNRNKKVWTKKAGVRNEALDAEVYCLHAARSLKTNLMHDGHWAALENHLRQRTLIALPPPDTSEEDADDVLPSHNSVTDTSPHEAADKPVADNHETAKPVQTPAPPLSPQPEPRRSRKRRGLRQRGTGFASTLT